MSNPNFYNVYRNSFTFQGNYSPILPPNFSFPPPPRPPPIYIPPFAPPQSDQDFLKTFEPHIVKCNKKKPKTGSISAIHEKVTNLVLTLDHIKKTENILLENSETLPDEEWQTYMEEIEVKKAHIKGILDSISDEYLTTARNLLAKRASKRLRMKRVKLERSREKKERIKQLEERSRKIDENLKKIKDDSERTKKEAEAKLHADMILKEVVRKKTDAKKCIVKLDALLRLRRARLNTAKGRGEAVSENETAAFEKNIEKLQKLWSKKLANYEIEEGDLRATLKQSAPDKDNVTEMEKEALEKLKKWRELLFGDGLPQVNFKGDMKKFVTTRCNWDKFVCAGGSALPLGWVVPNLEG